MKLYEFPPTRSIRVRWTLQELGVPFEAVTVNMIAGEHKQPAYLKVNPAGKLPALVDGDLLLTESVAICLYLAEKYPEKGFIPRDLAQRAELYKWILFAATELEQPLWRMARNQSVYPENRRVPADVANAQQDFAEMVAVLDAHMKSREFLVGSTVTVADFIMAYTLDWANEVGLLDECANLKAYVARMYARPKAAPRIAAAFASIGIDPKAN
jgi:glutathione S-transferase